MWAAWALIGMPLYVDGDATECPGDGSDATPFCTIQDAFDGGPLPGDEILVRDAATLYGGAIVNDVDGTAADGYLLQPDEGHAPVIGGQIEVVNSSYWTVRGLTFDGQDLENNHYALSARAGDGIVEGIVFEDNTIIDWGGALSPGEGSEVSGGIISATSSSGDGSLTMTAPTLRNNRILSSRGKAIRITDVDGGLVEGNEIAGSTCQYTSNGPGILGMHVHTSPDVEVARNYIHDFDATDCSYDGSIRVIGIWPQGSDRLDIHHNLIVRMTGQGPEGMGIDLINGSDSNVVHHNIVVQANQCGICNGEMAAGGGNNNRFINNTVIGGESYGLSQIQGENSDWINNIAMDFEDAQARIRGESMVWSFSRNLYLPQPRTDRVGTFGYGAGSDLSTWQSDCDCDADSVVADPMLPTLGPENFTAASGSPVIDAGADVPESDRFNGAGVDLGAIEAPTMSAPIITAGEPDQIRLDVQSETSPLRYDPGCSGFVVTIDDEPIAASECELDGDDRILIRLAEPAHMGDVVTLTYDGTSISNSDAIGGFVNGLLQPFTADVDNGSEESPPADSGDGTTDPTSGTSDSATDSSGVGETTTAPSSSTMGGPGPGGSDTDPGGDYPGVDGCSCRSQPERGPGAVLLLLLIALPPRRRTIA